MKMGPIQLVERLLLGHPDAKDKFKARAFFDQCVSEIAETGRPKDPKGLETAKNTLGMGKNAFFREVEHVCKSVYERLVKDEAAGRPVDSKRMAGLIDALGVGDAKHKRNVEAAQVAATLASVAQININEKQREVNETVGSYVSYLEGLAHGEDLENPDRLAHAMKALNKTPVDLANDLKIVRQYLSAVERCLGFNRRYAELERQVAENHQAALAAEATHRAAKAKCHETEHRRSALSWERIGRDQLLNQNFELLRHTEASMLDD
jgi:hypothetical protein